MNRRDFLARASAAAILPPARLSRRSAEADGRGAKAGEGGPQSSRQTSERDIWIALLRKVADPVLKNLAAGTLKARMPVEQSAGGNRQTVTHLEAIGRLIAGIAPWVELPTDSSAEGRLRGQYGDLARQAIARAVDPSSPDFMNFTSGGQPLVDAAFLGQGLLRAPHALREALDSKTKQNLVAALESTRAVQPGFNNWLLFSATVEAALAKLGAKWDRMRVDYALRQHDQWYKGDGAYGDGPAFHWDYYNSFVIQPMLLDVLDAFRGEHAAWKDLAPKADERARRYAAIQERFIGPDGTFPPIGRSLAYRCGAFHLLAAMALRRALPKEVTPAQVRGALTAIIRKTLEAPSTFDEGGWLRIGFCGHQEGIGETYISTGSLYLCSVAFLPLGLDSSEPFWAAPPEPWTQVRAFSGQPFPIDHAIST
jgi:hypothetical protein